MRTREGLCSQPSTQTQGPQHGGAPQSYSLTPGGGGEPGPGGVVPGRDIASTRRGPCHHLWQRNGAASLFLDLAVNFGIPLELRASWRTECVQNLTDGKTVSRRRWLWVEAHAKQRCPHKPQGHPRQKHKPRHQEKARISRRTPPCYLPPLPVG